jgi:cytochrome c oxidase cbb3-type subunit 3
MFKQILESMSGISIFGLISMIFFFLFFLGVIYWTIRADKKYLKKMENMPLDSSKIDGDLNHG